MSTSADRARGRTRPVQRLEGQRFGRLVVVRYGGVHETRGSAPRRLHVWVCRCDCDGHEDTCREDKLLKCITTSCGCARGERAAVKGARARWTREWRWRWMEAREATAPWHEALRGRMRYAGVTRELLRLRWSANSSFGSERLSDIVDRYRPPEAGEAKVLAQILNLRGVDRDRFLRLGLEAREATLAFWAARKVTAAKASAAGGGHPGVDGAGSRS